MDFLADAVVVVVVVAAVVDEDVILTILFYIYECEIKSCIIYLLSLL
jgi:hypothetical protein